MEEPAVRREDTSLLDVIHVLLLLQGAIGVLGGLAMLLFMGGNPLVLPVTLGTPLLLLVVAAGVVRRLRWAFSVATAIQALTLLGFVVSFLFGLLAIVDFSINLLTLVTNVAMPVALIRLLRSAKPAAAAQTASLRATPQSMVTAA
jgi:hypothetical protein